MKINKNYRTLYTYVLDGLFPDPIIAPHLRYTSGSLNKLPFRYTLPFQNEVLASRRMMNGLKSHGLRLDDNLLKGALQPFYDMAKDARSLNKRYKMKSHIYRDLAQPIYGLGNIVKGVFSIALAPLVFILAALIIEPLIHFWKKYIKQHQFIPLREPFKNHVIRALSWELNGFASLIRGITQIAFSPLTWVIKIPLRGLITAWKGYLPIEQNRSLSALIANTQQTFSTTYALNTTLTYLSVNEIKATNVVTEPTRPVYQLYDIHRKTLKAIQRGQKSRLESFNEQTENSHFMSIHAKLGTTDANDLARYLNRS